MWILKLDKLMVNALRKGWFRRTSIGKSLLLNTTIILCKNNTLTKLILKELLSQPNPKTRKNLLQYCSETEVI
jgi:hypothetical protein